MVLVYLLYHRYPNSWIRYINVSSSMQPVTFRLQTQVSLKPERSLANQKLTAQPNIRFVFTYLIRKPAFERWKRYNCKI